MISDADVPPPAFPRGGFRRLAACSLLMMALSLAQSPVFDVHAQDRIQFRHAFDDSALDVGPRPGEQFTDAVRNFHESGRDPYVGDATATAQGKQLYENWCQGCHMPDGSGHMGPSLIDDVYIYDRVPTDVGLFEVLFAGAGGAMQSFANRMSQDDMLKVIAYVRTLQGKN